MCTLGPYPTPFGTRNECFNSGCEGTCDETCSCRENGFASVVQPPNVAVATGTALWPWVLLVLLAVILVIVAARRWKRRHLDYRELQDASSDPVASGDCVCHSLTAIGLLACAGLVVGCLVGTSPVTMPGSSSSFSTSSSLPSRLPGQEALEAPLPVELVASLRCNAGWFACETVAGAGVCCLSSVQQCCRDPANRVAVCCSAQSACCANGGGLSLGGPTAHCADNGRKCCGIGTCGSAETCMQNGQCCPFGSVHCYDEMTRQESCCLAGWGCFRGQCCPSGHACSSECCTSRSDSCTSTGRCCSGTSCGASCCATTAATCAGAFQDQCCFAPSRVCPDHSCCSGQCMPGGSGGCCPQGRAICRSPVHGDQCCSLGELCVQDRDALVEGCHRPSDACGAFCSSASACYGSCSTCDAQRHVCKG